MGRGTDWCKGDRPLRKDVREGAQERLTAAPSAPPPFHRPLPISTQEAACSYAHLVDGDPGMDGGALGQSLNGDGEIPCRETRQQDEGSAVHAKGNYGGGHSPSCPSPSFSRINFSNRCLGNGNSVYVGAMWVLRQRRAMTSARCFHVHGGMEQVSMALTCRIGLPAPHPPRSTAWRYSYR